MLIKGRIRNVYTGIQPCKKTWSLLKTTKRVLYLLISSRSLATWGSLLAIYYSVLPIIQLALVTALYRMATTLICGIGKPLL